MANMSTDLKEMIQFWKYGVAVNDENEVETNFFSSVPEHSAHQMTFTRFNQTRTLPLCGNLEKSKGLEIGRPVRLMDIPTRCADRVSIKHKDQQ